MRRSQLFGRTLREVPSEAEIPSHQLLLQAGMIRRLVVGMYSYLPLAQRVLRKIENIIRDEMDTIGGQEIDMPLVQPAGLWQETGRWEMLVGRELAGFEDRFGRRLVLAMTHEEAVTDLVRNQTNSYRQLPLMLYQIKLKFRDEPRPRAGLIRVREFAMKDAYSFHADEADLDRYYAEMHQVYLNIFHRSGIDVVSVESDPGIIGGTEAHEFMLLADAGEDRVISCNNCGYRANADVAVMQKPQVNNGEPEPIEEVETPDQTTIEDVANYLGVEKEQTLKAVFYSTDESLIFAAIRGDMEVNETKLKNAVGATHLWFSTDEELRRYGLVAGYASPIDVKGVTVVVDDSVASTPNLIAGANKPGYHLKNITYSRDFKADVVADISLARGGMTCPHCGGTLTEKRGIEVGNIFKLGTKYSEAMNATYLSQKGRPELFFMGCYGIGLGRLLASIVEANHDEDGIIWPPAVAPYQIHLMHIGKGDDVREQAEALYSRLRAQGYEVLYDDRQESPGVKFKEADLLGMPLRLTISQRTLETDSVEIKHRTEQERDVIKLDELDPQLYL
jgi:prolyl-tRNA synthetase